MAEDTVKSASLRLFLAIPFQKAFLQEICSVLTPLSRKLSGVKWVDPEQVHLTLHFFGSTPSSEVSRIDETMSKTSLKIAPLNVRLDKIGVFPDMRRPNVIWLGIQETTGALLSFSKIVQGEIERLGFEIERRPFHPHVTIGRVKRECGDLAPMLAKIKLDLPTTEKRLDHFVLYQSHCFATGARYEIVKTYSMSG